MESAIFASKATVQICVPDQDGATSFQYAMDLTLDGSTFYCKLSTSARLISPVKKVPVYLFLDAGYVHSLEICDNKTEGIPPSVATGFVERAVCTSSDDIVGLRFRLKCNAPLFAPDSLLQKRRSTCDEIKSLLQIGRYETFVVYMSSSAIDKARLSSLCLELAKGTLKPVPEGVIKSLYHPDTTSQVITHLDQLSSLYSQGLPPYDPSTAPGASNDEASQSGPRPSHSSKRRSGSPNLHQIPSKRQLLTEKATLEPWQLAIAAQGAQIAALSAELSALREQVQQLQRAPGVNAETQTDPVIEHEPESSPDADQESSYVSHSQASTVENTIDDRLMMLEANVDERLKMLEQDIIEEQTQRVELDEKIENNNKELHENLELESCSLHLHVSTLTSRMLDLESELCEDLRKEFSDNIDAKGLELQVKLEDFCDNRLEDVEEVVKQDVMIELQNTECRFNVVGWGGGRDGSV